jgi:hypothetical protein
MNLEDNQETVSFTGRLGGKIIVINGGRNSSMDDSDIQKAARRRSEDVYELCSGAARI